MARRVSVAERSDGPTCARPRSWSIFRTPEKLRDWMGPAGTGWDLSRFWRRRRDRCATTISYPQAHDPGARAQVAISPPWRLVGTHLQRSQGVFLDSRSAPSARLLEPRCRGDFEHPRSNGLPLYAMPNLNIVGPMPGLCITFRLWRRGRHRGSIRTCLSEFPPSEAASEFGHETGAGAAVDNHEAGSGGRVRLVTPRHSLIGRRCL